MTDSTAPSQVIESVTLLKDHRCFTQGQRIEFRPGVNLMVGEQGAGKSTIFGLLRTYASTREHESRPARETVHVGFGPDASNARLFSFDFEKENKRTLSHFGDDISFQIQSMFSSHGESVNAMLNAIENDPSTGTLLLLDEPDMALSPRSIMRLARLLDGFAARGNQVICSVHNPLLILSQQQVLSLEHGKWMDASDFLAAHAEEPAPEPAVKPARKKVASKKSAAASKKPAAKRKTAAPKKS